jgi:RNA polymerase sigma factor (TIGR02999 family)
VSETADTTLILSRVANGEADPEQLVPLVYEELRAVAARFMSSERCGHTLQPTLIADEAFLRLIDQRRADWRSREQFFAVASRIIRRILIDHARQRDAAKRGGGRRRIELDDGAVDRGMSCAELLALDEALDELAGLNDRHRRVVELRFFGGLTHEASARVLGVSVQTIKSDWAMARAWLRMRLEG